MIQDKYKLFLEKLSNFVYKNDEISKIIFITILIKGSILIEDLPGTGKTTLARAIAKLLGFNFNRIHCTPDLIPQDIIGGEYYNLNSKNIEIKKGPIFTELFLVDEINRMNPKTQSAFLQAMEEKKVSIMGIDYELDENFRVIATQNPIEYSGTFTLPEAQKDRFFSKISIGHPTDEIQKEIILNNTSFSITDEINSLPQIFTKQDLKEYYNDLINIKISEDIAKRFVIFFNLIKENEKILYPISQRGIYIFITACKANAYINQRDYVISQDGFEIVSYFLPHRLDIEKSSINIISELYKEAFKHF